MSSNKSTNKIFVFLFLIIAIGLFPALTSLNAKQNKKSQARQWFEYAYHIEKLAPDRAAQMYAWALAKGLHGKANASLARTAYWRLYYLYLETQHYFRSLLTFGRYSKME